MYDDDGDVDYDGGDDDDNDDDDDNVDDDDGVDTGKQSHLNETVARNYRRDNFADGLILTSIEH